MTILKVEGAIEAPKPSPLAGQLAGSTADLTAYDKFAKPEAVEGNSLEALSALAQELLIRERELVAAQAAAVKAAKDLADVQETRLPALMEAHSLKKFTFLDKTTGVTRVIELIEKWRVSLPPKQGKTADPQWRTKHDAVYNWLVSIGKGGVIKKELVASLGLMDDEQAAEVLTDFKTKHPDLDVAFEKFVEAATLTSLVSKMKDNGEAVNEFVKVSPVHEARVKGSA